jgi:hypothetical protein
MNRAVIALALFALASPAFAQTPPSPVTPRACDVTTVTTGGTAVTAFTGPSNGYAITNPLTLGDQGIATAEPLLVNPVSAATAAANVTTQALPPGATFTGPPSSTLGASVNAATSGHKFTCVRW